MKNNYQFSWHESEEFEYDETLISINNSVEKLNKEFECRYPEEYKYGLGVRDYIGGIINTAIVTGNEANRLNNCSLNAVGLATRQPTHLVEASAMSILRNRDYFFWSKYVQPVEDQLKYIALYLSLLSENSGFTLFNSEGSQWFSLDQNEISSSEAYREMNEYEDGTKFIVGVGLLEDLIRDNSHYIYAEKINGHLIFMDGQTNLVSNIEPTFYTTYFDFSHIKIPLVTGMMYWALK